MARIPINIATGSLQKDDLIVGIDLGTTNSLIAIVHPESRKAVALREHDGLAMVPSIVHISENGEITVGHEARHFLESDPQNTIYSIKRLMGKSADDLQQFQQSLPYKTVVSREANQGLSVEIHGRQYTPTQVSSYILAALKKRAEHILKTPVFKAVITVPAYFTDEQRQATREAGKMAGLEVLRIINEPTASSLAYGIGSGKGSETVAVYDLGGGTFDVSILQITDGVFEVLSTHGDTYLGGDDFDKAIQELLMRMHGYEPHDIQEDAELHQSLRLKAEDVKKYLSEHEEFNAEWNGTPLHITRKQLEELIHPMVQKTLGSCRQALADAGLKPTDVQQVVMVGGSTRVPYVQQQVEAFFGRPVHNSLSPDEVVALGAAIQADILAGNNKELLLLDVTPLSLGIETMGGLMEVLIPRNSKIPGRAGRQFTTSKDGQANLRISVYQGERDLVKHNRLLGEFHLKGIPAMPAGLPKVEIGFLVNADGILVVTAKELRSGLAQTVEIKPQENLTDEVLEKMLLDGFQHAEADVEERALTEARVQGEQLLKTTEAFLSRHAAMLSKEELTETAHAMQALQLSITMADKKLIQEKQDALNAISEPYAQRIMDTAISEAMKGQKI